MSAVGASDVVEVVTVCAGLAEEEDEDDEDEDADIPLIQNLIHQTERKEGQSKK